MCPPSVPCLQSANKKDEQGMTIVIVLLIAVICNVMPWSVVGRCVLIFKGNLVRSLSVLPWRWRQQVLLSFHNSVKALGSRKCEFKSTGQRGVQTRKMVTFVVTDTRTSPIRTIVLFNSLCVIIFGYYNWWYT